MNKGNAANIHKYYSAIRKNEILKVSSTVWQGDDSNKKFITHFKKS